VNLSIGMLLKKLTVTYGQVIDAQMAPMNITKTESDVLVQLILHGTLTQRELCQLNGVTAASMSRTIKNLEEKYLIRVIFSQDDPRKHHIELTQHAEQLQEAIVSIKQSIHQTMMEGIGTEEVEILSRTLESMIHNLTQLR
jgi:DNA-binding MarR family transcriptional regulator